MKVIIVGPNEIPVRVDFHQDFVDYLVGGALPEDGIQYSAEVANGDAYVDAVVLSKVFDPGIEGPVLWVQFNLVAEFKSVVEVSDFLSWKWQARNKGGTWVDLHSAVSEEITAPAWIVRVRSGYFKIETNFNHVPFEVRLIYHGFKTNWFRGRVKNASFIRAIYKVV